VISDETTFPNSTDNSMPWQKIQAKAAHAMKFALRTANSLRADMLSSIERWRPVPSRLSACYTKEWMWKTMSDLPALDPLPEMLNFLIDFNSAQNSELRILRNLSVLAKGMSRSGSRQQFMKRD
jgi:hypothetical protein